MKTMLIPANPLPLFQMKPKRPAFREAQCDERIRSERMQSLWRQAKSGSPSLRKLKLPNWDIGPWVHSSIPSTHACV